MFEFKTGTKVHTFSDTTKFSSKKPNSFHAYERVGVILIEVKITILQAAT